MKNIDELSRVIGNLEGTIKKGFESVNQRLDISNGRLNKHDDKINTLETFRDEMIGKVTIIGAITGFVGAIVVSLIGWFLKK